MSDVPDPPTAPPEPATAPDAATLDAVAPDAITPNPSAVDVPGATDRPADESALERAPEAEPGRVPPPEPTTGARRANRRKVREGLVVSSTMDKTAVVAVIERVRHPRYAKTVQRTKRFYAHDPANDLRVGDRVRLAETRPMSKLKRWRVVQVLERVR